MCVDFGPPSFVCSLRNPHCGASLRRTFGTRLFHCQRWWMRKGQLHKRPQRHKQRSGHMPRANKARSLPHIDTLPRGLLLGEYHRQTGTHLSGIGTTRGRWRRGEGITPISQECTRPVGLVCRQQLRKGTISTSRPLHQVQDHPCEGQERRQCNMVVRALQYTTPIRQVHYLPSLQFPTVCRPRRRRCKSNRGISQRRRGAKLGEELQKYNHVNAQTKLKKDLHVIPKRKKDFKRRKTI